MTVTVAIEDVRCEDARHLLAMLTRELSERYDESDEEGAGGFHLTDVEVPGSAFVIARDGGAALGCGAIRPFDAPGVAEVKRMFVVPNARGRGVSKLILSMLERVAEQFGYQAVTLETGTRQPEAMGLYERMGYERCQCWGEYRGNPFSVCYSKRLCLAGEQPGD